MSKQQKYIEVRMNQLAEERDKCHDEHDKQWFNRCIQELDWVKQMNAKPTHDCYMTNTWTQDMTGTGQYLTEGYSIKDIIS
jgi:hypothetical protein